LLGRGDGTFSPAAPMSYTGGPYPFDVIAADLNHDGGVDLGIADFSGVGATVLLNIGSATPVALSNLEAESGSGYVELRWAAEAPASPVFQVLRSGSAQGPFAAVSGELPASGRAEFSWRDPTVTPGTTYYYKIAYRDGGVWQSSSPVRVVAGEASFGVIAVRP